MIDYPLVSVVLPVYNAEKYLKSAIESLLFQTYKNLEIIIINDGSSDDSDSIIKTFEDQRIQYFQQENMGLSKTLNKAIGLCKGEYVCRMDSDDICEINRITVQMNKFIKYKNAILVGSNVSFIDESDNITRYSYSPTKSSVIKRKLRSDNCIFHPSVIFKKEAFLKTGGYNEKVNLFFEDYLLWLEMIEQGDFIICREHLIKYREHSNSITSKTPAIVRDLMFKYSKTGELTEQDLKVLNSAHLKNENVVSNNKSTLSFVKSLVSKSRRISSSIIRFRDFFSI